MTLEKSKMKRVLGVVLAAGLAFVPAAALAVDDVVRSVDVVTGVFVVKAEGDVSKDMQFYVSGEIDFDELGLEAGEKLSIEYDRAQCSEGPACVSTANRVEPKS